MAEKQDSHFLLSLVLTAILWIVSAFVFGAAGMWVQLGSTGLQAAGLLAGAGSGDFNQSAMEAQGLLYTIISFVINLVIYYVIAVIIMFVFRLLLRKKNEPK